MNKLYALGNTPPRFARLLTLAGFFSHKLIGLILGLMLIPLLNTFAQTYCNFGGYANPGAGLGNYITNVSISNGGLNNSSSGTDGGFQDYTGNTDGAVTKGSAYSSSVTYNKSAWTSYLGVYIDWNDDGDFADANEVIVNNATLSTGSGTGTYTFTINVPSGASTATVRMRVYDNNSAVGACAFAYGEAEDYEIVITAVSGPTAEAGSNQTICNGASVNLGGTPTASGGTSPYTYSWGSNPSGFSSTSANPSVSPTTTTTYTITVTDNASHTATDNVVVTVGESLSLIGAIRCGAGQVTLTVNAQSGAYNWFTQATGGTAVHTGLTYSPTVSSTTTYYVEQQSSTSGHVGITTQPISSAQIWDGYTRVFPTSSNTMNFTTSQSNLTLTSVDIWTGSASQSYLSNFWVTIEDNSSNVLYTSSTYSIQSSYPSSNPKYQAVSLNTTLSNAGQYKMRIYCNAQADAWGQYGYGGTSFPTSDANGIITLNSGFDIFTNILFQSAGSTGSCGRASVTATVNSSLNVNLGNDIILCSGSTAILSAQTGNTYLWNTGDTTSSINVSPVTTTQYTVTASNLICTASDNILVTVYTSPTANAGADLTLNIGDSTWLMGSGGGNYLWNTGSASPMINVKPLITTTYTLTVEAFGCTDDDVVVVEILVDNNKRYWVSSNTSNWSNTANWSVCSGCAGGATIPDTSDIVYFDNLKNGNCLIDINASIKGLIIETGYSGEINGEIILSGYGNQVVKANQPVNGNLVLTINKPSGNIILQSPLILNDSGQVINFVKGNIISDSINYLSIGNHVQTLNASDSSFVDGLIKKIGNQAYLFPTGDSGQYKPIGITAPQSESEVFTAEFIKQPQAFGNKIDSTLGSVSNCEYWMLEHLVGNSAVRVTLYWNDKTCNVPNNRLDKFTITHWNGNIWENIGHSSYEITSNGGSVTSDSYLSSFTPVGFSIELFGNASDPCVRINELGMNFICNGDINQIEEENVACTETLENGFFQDNVPGWIDYAGGPELSTGLDANGVYHKFVEMWSNLTLYEAVCNYVNITDVGSYTFDLDYFLDGRGSDRIEILLTNTIKENPSCGGDGYWSEKVDNSSDIKLVPDFDLHPNGDPLIFDHLSHEFNITQSYKYLCFYTVNNTDNDVRTNLRMEEISLCKTIAIDITANKTEIFKCESVELIADGNASEYNWSTGGTTASITVSPEITTIYTVTGTNACGKTVTEEIVIIVNEMPMVVNAGDNVTICNIVSTTLSATGGEAYLWSTGANTPSINVSPVVTTTYTVTGTTNGCSASDEVVVDVIPAVTSLGFTFPKFDNCEAIGVPFTILNYDSNIPYVWNFNDGNAEVIVSGNPTTYTFNNPGYYRIKLSTNFEVGTCTNVTTSDLIYIIPSTSGYNADPDNCVRAFTNYLPDPDKNSTDEDRFNIEINNGETIANGSNIKGIITVHPGQTLNLTGTIHFGPQGRIIVQRGATLNLNGATLTSNTYCEDMMWQGIEVWGNASLPNTSLEQGKINMNNSTIENAYNGVVLGKFVLNDVAKGFLIYPDVFDLNFGGGILNATIGINTFNSNDVNMLFTDYPFVNSSKIANCNFKSDWIIHDPYTYSENTQITRHNPFYSIIYNTIHNSDKGIIFRNILENVSNNILGLNTFDNINHCIELLNSNINIISNTFTYSQGSVISDNWTYSNPANNKFNYSIINNCKFGIVQNGNKLCEIDGNTFSFDSPSESEGILLTSSSDFTIKNNSFSNIRSAIGIDNSGSIGGTIGGESGQNSFNTSAYGITGKNNNNALNLSCNSFNCNQTAWINNPTVYVKFAMQFSGTMNDIGDFDQATGNTFTGVKDILGNTTNEFTYWYQQGNDQVFKPNRYYTSTNFDIQPANNASGCTNMSKGGNDDIVNQEFQLSLLRDSISALTKEYKALEQKLDNNQTDLLLSAVESNANSSFTGTKKTNKVAGNLEKLLTDNSLLSDTVLIRLAASADQLPTESLKQILLVNMPVSKKVYTSLQLLLDTVSPVTAKLLNYAQFSSNSIKTLTSIDRKIHTYKMKKEAVLRDVLSYYVDNEKYDKVIKHLETENTDERLMEIVGFYVYKKDFKNANKYLKRITLNTRDNIAFNELYSIYIDMGNAGKTFFEMDSTQKHKIREIAQLCPNSMATTNARVLLSSYFNEEIRVDCDVDLQEIPSPKSIKTKGEPTILGINVKENADHSYLGQNMPNPFTNTTRIPYYLEKDDVQAEICIFDLIGRKLKTIHLNNNETYIEINMHELEGSVYTYSLMIKNVMIETKRMIYTK